MFDRRLDIADRRQGFVQSPPAAFQRLGSQIEEVRAANPRGGAAGELPHEQIDEAGKLALRPAALLGVGQPGESVDEEDVLSVGQIGNLPQKAAPPVVADIGVAVAVRLHENKLRPRRGGGQFIGYAGAAILLLRGDDDQDVAERQDPPQPRECRVGQIEARRASEWVRFFARRSDPLACASGFNILAIRRIRVGAIDKHKVRKRRQILLDKIDLAGGNAEHFRRQARPADDRGAECRWAVAAGANQFGARKSVDQ